jgi:hypothetical protein
MDIDEKSAGKVIVDETAERNIIKHNAIRKLNVIEMQRCGHEIENCPNENIAGAEGLHDSSKNRPIGRPID